MCLQHGVIENDVSDAFHYGMMTNITAFVYAQLLVLQCDVQKDEDLHKTVDETVKRFGRIDVLVRCSFTTCIRHSAFMAQRRNFVTDPAIG